MVGYLDGVDGPAAVLVVEGEEVVGDLPGSLVVSQSRIDEMRLPIFFNLEYRPDQSLYHRFVIDKTSPSLGRLLRGIDATSDLRFVIGIAGVHSNQYTVILAGPEHI
jgi:hypothetical protein